jgi:hypothetical protein
MPNIKPRLGTSETCKLNVYANLYASLNQISRAKFWKSKQIIKFKAGLPGQILKKVATKGKCDEKFLKKVAYLGALI